MREVAERSESRRERTFRATLLFAAISGEEQGLRGSARMSNG